MCPHFHNGGIGIALHLGSGGMAGRIERVERITLALMLRWVGGYPCNPIRKQPVDQESHAQNDAHQFVHLAFISYLGVGCHIGPVFQIVRAEEIK